MEHVYEHEQHTVYLIISHLIWCPKRRRKVFVGPVHDRLPQLIKQGVEENGWQIIELAIQPDHGHLFLRSNPYPLPTAIARLLKGRFSHELHEEFPHLKNMPSLWTRSTLSPTAGHVRSEIIEKYLERQAKS